MINTIEPGVLRVGVWDRYFRHDQHSLTRLRDCPAWFKWIDNCDDPAQVDIALATQNSGGVLLGSKHPRKVLYLQETSEFHGNRQVYMYEQFDLVLANDRFLVESPILAGKVLYQTLFGTWLEKRDLPPKTKLCSLLAGPNNFTSGHKLRHEVAAAAKWPGGPLFGLVDLHGQIAGGGHVPTEVAYDQYRFNLAICNSKYDFWMTEKVFNPMAARCVPIYWGCEDWRPVYPYGFTDEGIIRWSGSMEELREILRDLAADPEKVYTEKHDAIEQNYAAAHRWWCHELTLEVVLRQHFGFPANEALPEMPKGLGTPGLLYSAQRP